MKKLYKLGILLSAVGILASCYQEDDLTPSENGMILRYEMPQGNNAWDEYIAQIYEEYGVYLVYKGLKDADFNRSWSGSGTVFSAALYGGSLQDDEMAKGYVNFMKDHIFAYLTPTITGKTLPLYWYLSYGCHRKASLMGTYEYYQAQDFYNDGLDFWAVCMAGDEFPPTFIPNEDYFTPVTQQEYRNLKGKILAYIYEQAVKKGSIQIPEAFNTGFDHMTNITTGYADEEDPNYYLTRGYIGKVNGGGNAGSISISDVQDGLPPTVEKTFIGYLTTSLWYTKEQIEEAYPTEKYPFIKEKFNFVQQYMKDSYGIDLHEAAEGPTDWNSCNFPEPEPEPEPEPDDPWGDLGW